MSRNYQPLIKAIDRYIAKADDDLADELGSEGFIEPKRTVRKISKLEKGLAAALTAETAFFIAEIGKSKTLEDALRRWPSIKAADRLASEIAAVTAEEFQEFVPRIVDTYIHSYDPGLYLTTLSKRTTDWIRSWSDQLGELMQTTSQDELEKILTKGLDAGQGIPEFTRQIQESGIRNEYYRARTTALTEVLRAHDEAQWEAMMQSPAVADKAWKHSGTRGITPRLNHMAMDGQIVPKGEPFTLIGRDGTIYHPMYPCDPSLPAGESINCHCISQPIVDENIIGLPLEERKRLQAEAVAEMDDEWERELNERNRRRGVPGLEEEPES